MHSDDIIRSFEKNGLLLLDRPFFLTISLDLSHKLEKKVNDLNGCTFRKCLKYRDWSGGKLLQKGGKGHLKIDE